MMQTTVRLQREEFDAAAEAAALTRGRTDIGALVTFTGICLTVLTWTVTPTRAVPAAAIVRPLFTAYSRPPRSTPSRKNGPLVLNVCFRLIRVPPMLVIRKKPSNWCAPPV